MVSRILFSMKDILVGVKRLSVVHVCLFILGVIVLCALSLLPDEFVSNPSPKILAALLAFLPGIWRLTQYSSFPAVPCGKTP